MFGEYRSGKWMVVAATICSLMALTGCNTNSDKRIVILTNGNSPFWDAAREGMQDAAKDFKFKEGGLQAIFEVNDGTPEGQISKLRQFGSQSDIVGVAVSALDANNAAVADEMRKLRKKGVHVISVDADLDREKFRDARKYYIGTDNLVGGKTLGIAAKNLRPEGGEYVQFVGRTGSQNAIERMNGFAEAAGEKFIEKDRMGDDLDRTKARDNVRNAIRNFPELTTLVGIWSYNAPAIVDVVKDMNKPDLTVVVFDAEKLAIEMMGEGHIHAMIVQNPYNMGYQSARLLKALVEKDDSTVKEMFPNDGQEEGDLYDTGLKVVVPSEDSPLKKELFESNVEFLTLDKFKEWLAKYDLESS